MGDLALIKLMPSLLPKPVDQVSLLARVLLISLSEDRTIAICYPLALLRDT